MYEATMVSSLRGFLSLTGSRKSFETGIGPDILARDCKMDGYLLLRFVHLLGLMLMSAGLIGVFVPDMRSRQLRDLKLFATGRQDR
jgi:hypothetical protein